VHIQREELHDTLIILASLSGNYMYHYLGVGALQFFKISH